MFTRNGNNMKKFFLLFSATLLVGTSFGQLKSNSSQTDATYYQQKSRTQHRIAVGAVLAGGAMATAGVIIFFSKWDDDWFSRSSSTEKAYNTADVLGYSGCALMLTSVVLARAARRNKKIATSLSMSTSKVPQLQGGALVQQSVPSLTVTFQLGQ